jgi:hypothetical protein
MTLSVGEGDDVGSDCMDAFDYAMMAFDKSVWNGRKISRNEAADFCEELQRKITQLYREDEKFQQLLAAFVRHGNTQWFVTKAIEHLKFGKANIRETGLMKSIGKFWKKYKVPILIGAGVAAAVGVIIIVTVCSAGTAAGVAAAASAAALNNANAQPPPATEPQKESAAAPPPPAAETPTEPPKESTPPPPPPPTPPPTTENAAPPPVVPSIVPTVPPPLPSFLTNAVYPPPNGLWIEGQFYPFLSEQRGADPQFLATLPGALVQDVASYCTTNIASSEPSWISNALTLIGQGIIDSPSLIDPNAELLPPHKPSPTPWQNQVFNSVSDALKTIGEGIIDNPLLIDPDAPILPPWKDQVSDFASDALETTGEGNIDNPSLIDPNAQPPPPLQPSLIPRKEQPFNSIRDALEAIGKGVIDNSWLLDPNAPMPTKPPASFNVSIPGSLPNYFRIGGINGMNTLELEKNSHMAYIAKFAPDMTMDWVYNRTHGVTLDLAEIVTLNYAGYSPNTGELLKNNWEAFHEENKENPGAKYLQFCHSQGAIHVRNQLMLVPQEIRDRVIVIAIAPAAVVSKNICYRSFNYACKTDIVPDGEVIFAVLTSPIGLQHQLTAALEHRQELILLDAPPDSNGLNHDFQNPVFQEVIKDHINKYIINNGNYK